MYKVQQSGLILLSELGIKFELECLPVKHKKGFWWKLELVTEKEGIKDRGMLCTAHGEPRYFKQLNSVTDFLKENKIKVDSFTVKLK